MSRSTLLLASVAALTLAACSDSPVAPSSALAPRENASADIIVGGTIPRPSPVTLTLGVTSQGGGMVSGTTMKFESSLGVSTTVADNGAGDSDARPGYFSVTMTKANWYKVTPVAVPAPHSLYGATKTVSAFNTPTWVQMGFLMLNITPGIHVETWWKGAITTGQSIQITGPHGFSKSITDGGLNDEDHVGNAGPLDGKFNSRLPDVGTYTVCATSTPHQWYKADCKQVYVQQYYVQYSTTLNYWKYVGLPDNW
jgi:hypothetical protein